MVILYYVGLRKKYVAAHGLPLLHLYLMAEYGISFGMCFAVVF